jgi:putative flippase GtrA
MFGAVGAVCFVSDILLFNLFTFEVGMSPVVAKAVGMVITGAMAFVGHRHLTFRRRRRAGIRQELPRFALVTLVTVLLSVIPLYLARHVFGTTSVGWLNAANLAGIALGTLARFVAYKRVVWLQEPDKAADLISAAPRGGVRREVEPELVAD